MRRERGVHEHGAPVLEEAGVDNKIDLRIGPAVQTLDDMIADGGEGHYRFRVHRCR